MPTLTIAGRTAAAALAVAGHSPGDTVLIGGAAGQLRVPIAASFPVEQIRAAGRAPGLPARERQGCHRPLDQVPEARRQPAGPDAIWRIMKSPWMCKGGRSRAAL